MSAGPSFAIELRERYHELLGDRWPVAVAPQADELPSRWLHRVAFANGLSPQAFGEVLGGGGGMWSARLDLRLPQTLVAWLGARTGVSVESSRYPTATVSERPSNNLSVRKFAKCRYYRTFLKLSGKLAISGQQNEAADFPVLSA